ncbi:DeoR family transcriptional regulator [Slackia exigua]|uniref:DeoR family transcriptional regulator n=1 Tax=Slackia exigua TaxID=84109 RepID=UPI003C6F35CA
MFRSTAHSIESVPVYGRQKQILATVASDPRTTIKDMATMFGVATRTIRRDIEYLKDADLLERIGSDKTGYWYVKIGG